MNIQLEKQKICKAEKVIEMIEDARSRIEIRRKMITNYSCIFYDKQNLQREINTHESAIKRLENYYKNIFA